MPHLQHIPGLTSRHGLPPPPPLPSGAAAFASQLAKDMDRGLFISNPTPAAAPSPSDTQEPPPVPPPQLPDSEDDAMQPDEPVPDFTGLGEACGSLEEQTVEAALASIFEHFGHPPTNNAIGSKANPEAEQAEAQSVRSLSSCASSSEPLAPVVQRQPELVLEDPFQCVPPGGLSRRSHEAELRRVQQKNMQTPQSLRGRFTQADNRDLILLMQRAVEAVAWRAACDANPGLVQALETHNNICFQQEVTAERKLSHLLASPSRKAAKPKKKAPAAVVPKKKAPAADMPKAPPRLARLTRAQVLQQRWRGLSTTASSLRDKVNDAEKTEASAKAERHRQLRTEIMQAGLTEAATGGKSTFRHHRQSTVSGVTEANQKAGQSTGQEPPAERIRQASESGLLSSEKCAEDAEALSSTAQPKFPADDAAGSEAKSHFMDGMVMDNAPRTNMDLLRWSRRASRTLDSRDQPLSSSRRNPSPTSRCIQHQDHNTANRITLEAPMQHVGMGTVRAVTDQAVDPNQMGGSPPLVVSPHWLNIDELMRRRGASESPQDSSLCFRSRPYSQRGRYGSSDGEDQQRGAAGSPGSPVQVAQPGPFAERPPAVPSSEVGGLYGTRRRSQLDRGSQSGQSPRDTRGSWDGASIDVVPPSLLPNFPGLRFHSQHNLAGQRNGKPSACARDSTLLASARNSRGYASSRRSLDDSRPLTSRQGRKCPSETSSPQGPGLEQYHYTVLMKGNEHFSGPAHLVAKRGEPLRVSHGAAEPEAGVTIRQDDVTPGASLRMSLPADHKPSGWLSLMNGHHTEGSTNSSADFSAHERKSRDLRGRSASMRAPRGTYPASDPAGLQLAPQERRTSLIKSSSSKRKKKRSSKQTSQPKPTEVRPVALRTEKAEKTLGIHKVGQDHQGTTGKDDTAADSVHFSTPVPCPPAKALLYPAAPAAPSKSAQRQQHQLHQLQGGSFSYPNIDISTVLGSRGSESNRGLQKRMIDMIRYQSDSVKEERDKEGI